MDMANMTLNQKLSRISTIAYGRLMYYFFWSENKISLEAANGIDSFQFPCLLSQPPLLMVHIDPGVGPNISMCVRDVGVMCV